MLRAFVLLILAASLQAEVVEKSASGMLVRHKITVAANPQDSYKGIVAVGNWWEGSHSYSRDAKNLSIVTKAGGCFCEQLPNDRQVQHMTVVTAMPGLLLRMTGALGPL